MRNKWILLLLLAGSMFCSCRKKEENSTAVIPRSNKQLLMDGRWQVVKMETIVIMSWDTVTMDITTSIPGCSLDDIITYHPSGFKVQDAGALTCYTGQVFDTLKTWSMPSESQLLEHDIKDGYEHIWVIEHIDAHTLKMSHGIVDSASQKNTLYLENRD